MIALLLSLFALNLTGTELAQDFHSLKNRSQEDAFILRYGNNTDPSIQAYVLTIRIKHLSSLLNPYSKWSGFKRYSKELDRLVSAHPQNIHLRYCRLMVQEQSPSFLGYTDHLETDRLFLKTKLAVKDPTDYMDTYIKENTSL